MGALILVGSLGFALLYVWWLLFSPWSYYALVLPVLVAVMGISIIAAWIGYTMATTPAPAPLEDMGETEKEGSQSSEESS